MNEEFQTAYKIRQALNQGAETLDPGTAERLFQARMKALARHRNVPSGILGLAGFDHLGVFFGHKDGIPVCRLWLRWLWRVHNLG